MIVQCMTCKLSFVQLHGVPAECPYCFPVEGQEIPAKEFGIHDLVVQAKRVADAVETQNRNQKDILGLISGGAILVNGKPIGEFIEDLLKPIVDQLIEDFCLLNCRMELMQELLDQGKTEMGDEVK